MSCPKCNDVGYIEDRENNTMIQYCDCAVGKQVWRAQWEKKLVDAEIPQEFWDLKFNDFCPQPSFVQHLDYMRTLEYFLKNIELHRKEGTIWLITGESGVGKTLGGAFILKQALKKDYSAKYAVWTNILDDTLDDDKKRGLLDELREVDFLVIDDLGSDKINASTKSNYSADLLEKLVKPRYSSKRPTILISSMKFSDLTAKFPIIDRMVPDVWRSAVKGISFRKNKMNIIKPPTQ